MDEREFEKRAAEAWKHVLDLFEDFDPEDADVEQSGDVIRIDYRGGQRVVLNTQRPARQLWLAGGSRAWHFNFDPTKGLWFDDKDRGDELYATLSALTLSAIGRRLGPDAT
ncbi:MAG: iron donor protein CyaY [Polyangiales bacterium]